MIITENGIDYYITLCPDFSCPPITKDSESKCIDLSQFNFVQFKNTGNVPAKIGKWFPLNPGEVMNFGSTSDLMLLSKEVPFSFCENDIWGPKNEDGTPCDPPCCEIHYFGMRIQKCPCDQCKVEALRTSGNQKISGIHQIMING